MKYDNIVEVILAGSPYLSLRKSCFKENNIIDFRVPFSIGDLSKINDYVVKLPKCIYNEEIICNLNNDILILDSFIDKDYKVRIWSSHYDVDSYLLLLFICNYLKDKVDNIIVLYSDEYKKECYSPGVMTSKELEKLSTLEHVISKEEINMLAEKWEIIKYENSYLRIIENKKVKSVDYDYFNDEIINILNQKKSATIIDIVYELTKKYYISDSVFTFLITRLINCGKIRIIEKNEKFIKSIIGGCKYHE